MEMLLNDNQRTKIGLETILSERTLNSQSILVSHLVNLKNVQLETSSVIEQLIQFVLKNNVESQYQIESFHIEVPSINEKQKILMDSVGSPGASSGKRMLKQSNSCQLIESSTEIRDMNSYIEDEQNLEIETVKSLNRIKSELNLVDNNEEMMIETNSYKQSNKQRSNSQQTTQTTTYSHSLNTKPKIRGFNFKNNIKINKHQHNQLKILTSTDPAVSNNNIKEDFQLNNFAQTYSNVKSEQESLIKPQIVPEKQIKHYWNLSLTKSYELQHKIKENFVKSINTKKVNQ